MKKTGDRGQGTWDSFVAILLFGVAAFASLVVHAHEGEPHDGPAPVLSAGASVPRLEAKSELFELVARVEGGALSILIDRYQTNEPVLDAAVEVESGSLKGKAKFRREQGDYLVDDAAFVKALASPGAHALVFTVSAGKDSDLLDGSLQVAGGAAAHGRPWYLATTAWLVAAIVLAAAALFIRARRGRGNFR